MHAKSSCPTNFFRLPHLALPPFLVLCKTALKRKYPDISMNGKMAGNGRKYRHRTILFPTDCIMHAKDISGLKTYSFAFYKCFIHEFEKGLNLTDVKYWFPSDWARQLFEMEEMWDMAERSYNFWHLQRDLKEMLKMGYNINGIYWVAVKINSRRLCAHHHGWDADVYGVKPWRDAITYAHRRMLNNMLSLFLPHYAFSFVFTAEPTTYKCYAAFKITFIHERLHTRKFVAILLIRETVWILHIKLWQLWIRNKTAFRISWVYFIAHCPALMIYSWKYAALYAQLYIAHKN